MKQLICILLLLLPAEAATLHFGGTFGADDQSEFLVLDLGSPGTLTAQTDSFASGGFAPVLSLFDSTGLLLATDAAGGPGPDCGPRATDPSTGFCWDAFLSVPLAAGQYTLAVTQDDNRPFGPMLSDSFLRSGQGNFTGPTFIGQPGSFVLISGAQRSGVWSLSVTSDSLSQVPEPASAVLLLVGVCGLTLFRIRAARLQREEC